MKPISIGTTYFTHTGVDVIPIKALPGQKAIFVTSEFIPTPFVIWEYQILSNNEISLYSGAYYCTLDDALAAAADYYMPKPKHLNVSIICPLCEGSTSTEIDLEQSVQSIVEDINDVLVCDNCGKHSGLLNKIELIDERTTYSLPLYNGPLKS